MPMQAADKAFMNEGTRASLETWFASRAGSSSARIVEFRPISGGLMNETFLAKVVLDPGRLPQAFVLRWDPGDGVMAPYDMAFQFRIYKALEASEIPVPQAFWLEQDSRVIGRDFFVVQYVEGEAPGRLLELHTESAEARFASFVQTLNRIHRLDWQGLGMGALFEVPSGKPAHAAILKVDRFLERVTDTALRKAFDQARGVLLNASPSTPRLSLVHGDCSLSNYLFRENQVVAVIDWELSSISDRLQDAGFYCSLISRYRKYTEESEFDAERKRFSDAYASASGADLQLLPFWEAVACYRNAVMSAHPDYAPYATDHYRRRLKRLLAEFGG